MPEFLTAKDPKHTENFNLGPILERIKKNCGHVERGFLSFGERYRSSAFGEGAVMLM
jgi:hypothetical protein